MRKEKCGELPSRESVGGQKERRLVCLTALLATATFLCACSPQQYYTRADRETYGVLFAAERNVENVSPADVDIENTKKVDLSKYKANGTSAEYLGEMASFERGAKVLSLDEALEASVSYGREYLTRKESVFLNALDLTLARFELSPMFRADAGVVRASDSRSVELEEGFTELVAENTFSRTQSASVDWLLATGARLSADFTQDFLRIMSGNQSINESDLAVSLVQPLLQGGGTTVTLETLTQAERDLLYDLRAFADFRRSYIVSIVTDYYNVLQARDRVQNSYVAYQGFVESVEREEAFAEEDRRTQTELGQLRQAALQSESRWIDAIRLYQGLLDEFKITLGLPVDKKFILDEGELERLKIEQPGLSREEAVEVALVTRPDLATAVDIVEDAERHIEVAKNGLLPGLDVAVDYRAVSNPDDTTPAINWDRRRWATSLDVRAPLDRKAERNIYRATFVSLNRAERAKDLSFDEARLDIYSDWRALEQTGRNFEIAVQGVSLAARRLEEQQLLAELGKGDARDLVDSQNDLVEAQNQRTATVIDHTLARLRLWRDMGILYINEDGSWVEKLKNEPR